MNFLLLMFKKVASRSSLFAFAVVGVISTVIDIAVLNFFANLVHTEYHIATALGFLAGLVNGFYLNSSLVFATKRSVQKSIKYTVTSLGGLLLTEIIITIVHEHLGVTSLTEAKLVAAFIVLFWNYGLSKVWAFKD